VEDMPHLTMSCDMGWQKRSSGRRRDSHSGHCIPFGMSTKKPIAVETVSQHCSVCRNKKRSSDNPPPAHECRSNFVGDHSGAMEPEGLVRLVIELLDEQKVLIGLIFADDDSTTQTQMKWSNADWMTMNKTAEPPRVAIAGGKTRIRPDTGRLPLHCPEPTFAGDPSHRTKTVGGTVRSVETQALCGVLRE
jgi:hypothetical protein